MQVSSTVSNLYISNKENYNVRTNIMYILITGEKIV